MIGNIKGIIDKVASRKLGVTAVAGAAAATGAMEVTWLIAATAMAYFAGQTVVDVTELLPESGPSLAVSHQFSLVFVDTASIDCK